MKMTGQVVEILPVEEFSSGFAKRTMVINYTPERDRASYLVVEAKRGKEKDRTTLLDLVGVGQMVEVEFYPDGREWVSPAGVKKWFASNTLAGLVPMGNAVKSSGSGVPRTPASASDAPVVPPSVEIEDLPF